MDISGFSHTKIEHQHRFVAHQVSRFTFRANRAKFCLAHFHILGVIGVLGRSQSFAHVKLREIHRYHLVGRCFNYPLAIYRYWIRIWKVRCRNDPLGFFHDEPAAWRRFRLYKICAYQDKIRKTPHLIKTLALWN